MKIVAAIAVIWLTACVSKFPDQNKDPAKNNQATFRKDLKECQDEYPITNSGAHVRQWQSCMNLKGWQ